MYGSGNPVEDRFGFFTKGTFRCSRATERVSVILAIIITLLVFGAFYMIWGKQLIYIYGMHYEELKDLDESQRMGYDTVSTSHILFFALSFSFVTVVIFTVGFTAIKLILGGVEYRYTADNNIFSFYSEKDNVRKTDIHYDDVIAVRYDERKLFGILKRGYTVTIITHSLGNVTLDYIFNKSSKDHSPQNTPFSIIEARVGLRQKERNEVGLL